MSAIEWTDKTWNPIAGCDRLSPGCDNCYAIKQARRCEGFHHAKYMGTTTSAGGELDWSGSVNFDPNALLIPYKTKKPTIWFVNSMSDIGHHKITERQAKAIFEVMNKTPHHHYQILTKRPSRIVKIADQLEWTPNIWFGVSVENVKYGEQRLKELRKIPAAIRFVSAEPLLGDVSGLDYSDIHWIIAGGESGVSRNKIRPMVADWVRNLRDTCRTQHIPFFFKQWGNYDESGVWHKSKAEAGHLLDGQELFEMPTVVQSLINGNVPTVKRLPRRSKAHHQARLSTLIPSSPMSAQKLHEANNMKDGGTKAVHSHSRRRVATVNHVKNALCRNGNEPNRSKTKKIRLISGLSEAEQKRMVEERPSDIRYIDAPTPAVQFMAALRDIRTVKMIHGSIDILVSDYIEHKRKGESKPPYVSAFDE